MSRKFPCVYNFKNKISHILARLKTILWYKHFFGYIGHKSTFYTPIRLISPENIFLGDRVNLYKNSRIETIQRSGKYAPKIQIEDGTSFEQNLHMICADNIVIGCETVVSSNVFITDADHQYTEINKNILHQPLIVKPVKIGSYCFIGMGAKIFPGTQLGDGCVVGAGSIVKGVFPEYSLLGNQGGGVSLK